MRPIRICHCIDDLQPGGAQQVVRHLVENLDPRGFQPLVYTFQDGPFARPIVQSGVTVRVLRRRLPKLDPMLVCRLRRQLAADQIDIVHMHLFGATLHGTLAAAGSRRLARVITIHCPREDNRLQRRAYSSLFSMAQSVIGVSRDVSQTMSRRYPGLREKLVTIPNGINHALYRTPIDAPQLFAALALTAGARVVGTVGRLSGEKAQGLLLEAFRRVRMTCPNAFLLIVGDGEERDALSRRAIDLGIGSFVRFLGARADVPALLQIMDVFVLSSLWEGLPLVLLEAMTAGVPVVSTAVGGVPEVIEHEHDGLLVPPSDAQAIASAVSRILADSNLAAQLRRGATATVQRRHSAQRMASRHESLYATLCGRDALKRPPAPVRLLDLPEETQ